jgi:hypothetical protein
VLDTSATLALLNEEDRHHGRCVELVSGTYESLVVPAATLGELDYWFRRRMTPEAWLIFVDDIAKGVYRLEPLIEGDLQRAAELQVQYHNLDLDLVDASVIALCERLGEPKVATLDRRDFSVVVPRHVRALQLLPE